MDDQRQSRWRLTRRQVLWASGIAALAFLIIVICGYVFEWKWTGLPKRTLWNWLQLLIIPAVLAGVGLWFNRQQREQELQTADRRAQDEALQAFLDQMSDMLIPSSKDLPSLHKARPGDSLSEVARARTLTVLPRLDGHRKARVVQFLYEARLIDKCHRVLDLSGADLSGVVLRGANLQGANLSEALLRGANLEVGILTSLAEPSPPVKTNLRGADLSGADLFDANLYLADLSGANLSEAIVDLDQLAKAASLKDATMTDGQKYEESHAQKDVEWLKSKGRGEDGENSGPS